MYEANIKAWTWQNKMEFSEKNKMYSFQVINLSNQKRKNDNNTKNKSSGEYVVARRERFRLSVKKNATFLFIAYI